MTRAPRGTGSVFKRSNNGQEVWQASRSYIDEATGKRRFVTGTGKTQAEAIRRREANLTKRLGRAAPAGLLGERSDKPTVEEVFNQWLLSKSHAAPSTVVKYRGDVRKWILPRFGNLPLDSVKESDLYNYFHQNDGNMPGPSVVKQVFSELRQIYNFAVTRRIIDPSVNPFLGIEPVKGYVPAVRTDDLRLITQRAEMSKKLLQHLKDSGSEDYSFILILFLGLRVMEASGITMQSLENIYTPNRASLTVDQQLYLNSETGDYYLRRVTKNRSSRKIFLPEAFRDALCDELERGKSFDSGPMKDLVFVQEDDNGQLRATTHYQARRMWNRVWRSFGYEKPPFRLHYCRAVTASIILQVGKGEASSYEALKQIIGNSTLASNLYYSHLMEETRKGASSNIEQWLTSTDGD